MSKRSEKNKKEFERKMDDYIILHNADLLCNIEDEMIRDRIRYKHGLSPEKYLQKHR